MQTREKAIVLLSGGLDSTTTLYLAKKEGFCLYALSFDYGQRNSHELKAAARIADLAGCEQHAVIRLDPFPFLSSALVDRNLPVPGPEDEQAAIPITYVPARNMLFLVHALAWAETIGARQVFLGVNALDYSGYPDCRPEFLEAFEKMAALGMKTGVEGNPVRIRAPLLHLNKAEIVRAGLDAGVDFSLTSSCYNPGPGGSPCGRCDSCRLRSEGFRIAGVVDPLQERRP